MYALTSRVSVGRLKMRTLDWLEKLFFSIYTKAATIIPPDEFYYVYSLFFLQIYKILNKLAHQL